MTGVNSTRSIICIYYIIFLEHLYEVGCAKSALITYLLWVTFHSFFHEKNWHVLVFEKQFKVSFKKHGEEFNLIDPVNFFTNVFWQFIIHFSHNMHHVISIMISRIDSLKVWYAQPIHIATTPGFSNSVLEYLSNRPKYFQCNNFYLPITIFTAIRFIE